MASRPCEYFLFHPNFNKSKLNKRFFQVSQDISNVTSHNVYDIYPHFFIDFRKEQEKLNRAHLIVLQFPFYWYSTPALLKEWLDQTLLHGYAYGHGGNALSGKGLQLLVTCGGDTNAYRREGSNLFSVTELLRPFEATANLCKMIYLEPFIFHGSDFKAEQLTFSCISWAKYLKNLIDSTHPLIPYSTL
jgi:glutathione-regulated potassium-efflux system ancillary protein KefG